ncbi:hypothetical protein M1373_03130 [Candidatus Marsarchaeota archaeon]|nr:hypothetical protein [Candidatus Marsarchaeota archaeon]MCL5404549.1 hypothetical protein [Candidatus Marsarchaeota archaeon]
MGIRIWYYRHFDREKLLEELSKPVEGTFVVIKEGNMMTRIRKEELDAYMELKRARAESMLKEYGEYASARIKSKSEMGMHEERQ